jgi:hypothetical protein
MALTTVDSERQQPDGVKHPDADKALENLITARRRYWAHVKRHGCRKL